MKTSPEEGVISGVHQIVHPPITIIFRNNPLLNDICATIQTELTDAGYKIETLLIPQGSTGRHIQDCVRGLEHSVGPILTDTTVKKACPWLIDRESPFGTIDRVVAEATYESLSSGQTDKLDMTQQNEEGTLRGLAKLLKLIHGQAPIRECDIYPPGLSEHMPFVRRLTGVTAFQNLTTWPPDRKEDSVRAVLEPVERQIAETIQEAITQVGIRAQIISTLPTSPLSEGHIIINDQHYDDVPKINLVTLPLPLANAYSAAWRHGMLGPDHANRIKENLRNILRKEAQKALAA